MLPLTRRRAFWIICAGATSGVVRDSAMSQRTRLHGCSRVKACSSAFCLFAPRAALDYGGLAPTGAGGLSSMGGGSAADGVSMGGVTGMVPGWAAPGWLAGIALSELLAGALVGLGVSEVAEGASARLQAASVAQLASKASRGAFMGHLA